MMKAAFGEENVFSPTLPVDPHEAQKVVWELISELYEKEKENLKLTFVGTSLGGFYATFFAMKWDCPAIIVNPSILPDKVLGKKLGLNKNHATGDEFLLTLAHLEELELMRLVISAEYKPSLLHVFVARDDNVVNADRVISALPNAKSVNIFDDGGHRFEKNWYAVVEKLKEIQKS